MDAQIARPVPVWEPGKTMVGLGIGMAISWMVFFPSNARLAVASILLVQVGSAALITGRLKHKV